MGNVNKPNHYMLDGIPGVEVKKSIDTAEEARNEEEPCENC